MGSVEAWKGIFLFIGIWRTIVNLSRMHARHDLSTGEMIIQAIGITGFIYLQWLI